MVGRAAALLALGTALALYYAFHDRLWNASTWWDIGFIALALIPACFALVWLVLNELPIADDELNASRRRAMFILAAGGDPHRDLDLNTVAAERLAGELDSPERRQALHDALGALEAEGLPAVQDGLSALQVDAELAWRCLGLALLADELADE